MLPSVLVSALDWPSSGTFLVLNAILFKFRPDIVFVRNTTQVRPTDAPSLRDASMHLMKALTSFSLEYFVLIKKESQDILREFF